MTAPLVPIDVDLSGFDYFPLYVARLFGSGFHARASDSEWRAGVTLWLKSWEQHPPGSLPNDDIDLCHLAELGRNQKIWRKLKPMALHGWELADDGRLYHAVVAEVVNDAWDRKCSSRLRTSAAREARLSQRKKSPVTFARETDGKDFPPKSPQGDFFKNGQEGRPNGEARDGPLALHPKILQHSLPCSCPNCTRWVEQQKGVTLDGR